MLANELVNKSSALDKPQQHQAQATPSHQLRENERATSYAHPPAIMSLLAKNRPPPSQSNTRPAVETSSKTSPLDEDGLTNEDDEVKVYGDEGPVEEEKRCSKTLVEDKNDLVKNTETQPTSFSVNSIMGSGAAGLSSPYVPGHGLLAAGRSPFYNPAFHAADLAHQFASWWPTVAAAALYGAHHNPFAFSFPPISPSLFLPQSPAFNMKPTIPGPNFHAMAAAQHKPMTPSSYSNQTPSPMSSSSNSEQRPRHKLPIIHPPPPPNIESARREKPHVKKPLNAFMLFMKEQRPLVLAESEIKESAAINAILGQKWHNLNNEEKSKYFAMATEERRNHMKEHPDWSARDNYGIKKKGKRKRERPVGPENDNLPRKCRARFGIERVNEWCKPCRRKKKCIRFGDGETGSIHNDIENEEGDEYDSYDEEFDPREAKMSSRPISNMPLVYSSADNINRER